jgi:hypothetical protein
MALCLSLLCSTAAFAADTAVRVVAISGNHWSDDVKIAADAGDVTMRNSDCGFGAVFTDNLSAGSTELLRDFSLRLCRPPVAINGLSIGVVSLHLISGTPRVWTIGSYDDGRGNFNNVRVDSLPKALAPGAGRYVFYGAESGSDPTHPRTTQLALMAEDGGDLGAKIELFDGHGVAVAESTAVVQVRGWSLYTIATDLEIGRVEVTTVLPNAGPSTPASLYAIALTFDSRGGAPEVEIPRLVTP